MMIFESSDSTNFGDVPSGGVFAANGEIYISLRTSVYDRDGSDGGEEYDAVNLRTGECTLFYEAEPVIYHPNATLTL